MKLNFIISRDDDNYHDACSIDADVIAYMLSCHNLALRDWEKEQKNKLLEVVADRKDKENAYNDVREYYDELKRIEQMREQAKKLGEACQNVRLHCIEGVKPA